MIKRLLNILPTVSFSLNLDFQVKNFVRHIDQRAIKPCKSISPDSPIKLAKAIAKPIPSIINLICLCPCTFGFVGGILSSFRSKSVLLIRFGHHSIIPEADILEKCQLTTMGINLACLDKVAGCNTHKSPHQSVFPT